ncbi:MAG: YjbQ family protein [Oligoflexales bacterium]|nr:YjbQ family protein [Oligoflexales bacterium]
MGRIFIWSYLIMGTWQGIYLAEFRKAHQNRRILVKFLES